MGLPVWETIAAENVPCRIYVIANESPTTTRPDAKIGGPANAGGPFIATQRQKAWALPERAWAALWKIYTLPTYLPCPPGGR